MNKPYLANVKRKPKIIELLPGIGKSTAQAIYPNIYVSSLMLTDVHSLNPSPHNIALILHEQEHIKRQNAYGVLRWYLRYILSAQFRFEEELAACVPQFIYIRKAGLTPDIKRKAKSLSSWLYLWSVTYDKALQRLSAI